MLAPPQPCLHRTHFDSLNPSPTFSSHISCFLVPRHLPPPIFVSSASLTSSLSKPLAFHFQCTYRIFSTTSLTSTHFHAGPSSTLSPHTHFDSLNPSPTFSSYISRFSVPHHLPPPIFVSPVLLTSSLGTLFSRHKLHFWYHVTHRHPFSRRPLLNLVSTHSLQLSKP